MITELAQAQLVNGIVPLSTLYGELGRDRPVTRTRPVLPLLVAVAIVPLCIRSLAVHGTGLTVELAGIMAGFVAGFTALSLIRVFRVVRPVRPVPRGRTGADRWGAVSRAGLSYALVWIVVFAARAAFSYGCVHWFPVQLAQWRVAHQVNSGVIPDGLVFMADVMIATCTLGVAVRAATLPPALFEAREAEADA